MKLEQATRTIHAVPRRRWYIKCARAVAGLAVIVVGVPMTHQYGWPWHAQAIVAVVGGLVFSTDFVKLGAKTMAAAIRDVLTAIKNQPEPPAP